jgi:hypothetical protein
MKMIIDATKINYFNNPERSAFDQPKSRVTGKKNKQHDEDLGVIIDASMTAKTRRKKVV